MILTLVLVVSTILYWGCISLRVKALPPADNQVESIALCLAIDESGELLAPLEPRVEFPPDQRAIFCFLRLQEVSREIQLRWKWFAPDEKMVRDTGNVAVNLEQRYLEVVTAYDELDLGSAGEVEGIWTVAIFLDDRLAGSRTFTVKKLLHSMVLCFSHGKCPSDPAKLSFSIDSASSSVLAETLPPATISFGRIWAQVLFLCC